LWWVDASSTSWDKAEVRVFPKFTVDFITPLTSEEIWRGVATPLLFLTSFACGLGDSVRRIESWRPGKSDDDWDIDRADWLGGTWREPPEVRPHPLAWRNSLLSFEDVADRFDEVVPAWFSLYQAAQYSMYDLFLKYVQPPFYLEDSFSRIVRGLETWHRLIEGGQIMDEEEFDALLKRLREAAGSGTHRQFVQMRLKYGNELTLKQRLDALIDQGGEPMSAVVESLDRFTRRVTDVRNSMTHFGEVGESLTFEQLWAAQTILELVIRSVMLRKLGYDGELISTAIKRTQLWESLWLNEMPPGRRGAAEPPPSLE
jgi:hypothetical protein